jgi:hypothetical protein
LRPNFAAAVGALIEIHILIIYYGLSAKWALYFYRLFLFFAGCQPGRKHHLYRPSPVRYSFSCSHRIADIYKLGFNSGTACLNPHIPASLYSSFLSPAQFLAVEPAAGYPLWFFCDHHPGIQTTSVNQIPGYFLNNSFFLS